MSVEAKLRQPLEETIRQGHPWVFADALRHPSGLEPGQTVELLDQQGSWLARGVLDPNSPLRLRIWTLDRAESIDEALLIKRVKQAGKRRLYPTHETTGYRMFNGEGDRLPGLVCDVYGRVAVLRLDGEAAERWLGPLVELLTGRLGMEHVAVRRSERWRGDRPRAQWVGREPEELPIWFREGGLEYSCDPIEGQKTGFFLDQRANRARLAQYCVGKRLLNLFGYTGGFSLAAAAAGAARTVTVDQSAPALEAARAHFERNDLWPAAHGFEAADVFEYLEQFEAGSAPFEVVVCDPPSFVHRRRDLARGLDAYRRLFAKVLAVMPPGATVALASCSSQVHRGDFLEVVRQAQVEAGRQLVSLGCWGADSDHPIVPAWVEGEYLQFLLGALAD